MVRGLYTAYTGMNNEQKRLDIISNNLANATTVGFKEDSVANQSFDNLLTLKVKDASEFFRDREIGTMSLGVKLGEVYTKHDQGSLRETGNTYDLALDGKGFFAVSVTNAAGEQSVKYTRDGSFKITQSGNIVDAYGNQLMTEAGTLQVPTEAAAVTIDTNGSVYADGVFVDTIQKVDFENYDYIEKYGNNLYQALDGATQREADALIRQGWSEQSNVNSVSEMVEMISITRAYEAGQKVIKTVDGMLDLAVNSVGKV